jgi:hypothetical protein
MDPKGKTGSLLIALFGLPFAFFGLFAMQAAIRQMATGRGKGPFWLPLLLGTVFSTIGVGLMFAAVWGSKLLARQQSLQAKHPTEPWLWREDWVQGRVQSKTRGNMIGAWIFAIIWNLVSTPVLFIVPTQAAKKPAVYIALLFPIVGVFLLIRAIRQSVAYAEFGKTYFEMSSVPGVIGGELRGTIQARFPRAPEHGILLRLSCIHTITTGSGDSQSTNQQILWRDEHRLSPAEVCAGPFGASFPVSFRIPWDASASEKQSPRSEFSWLLEALADVPGVDYHDVFEVPVFRTSQTPPKPEPAPLFAQSPPARPEVTTIEVRQTAEGTEFFFPAARNKATSASGTLFLLFFLGLSAFFSRVHIPLIFVIGCGFFSLIMIFINVQQWLGTTRVIVRAAGLSLQAGLLGGGKVQEVPFSEISTIALKIQTQQGGATGTPFYDIELINRYGKKFTLGRALRNKEEADWLISEMRRLAGLQAKAASMSF